MFFPIKKFRNYFANTLLQIVFYCSLADKHKLKAVCGYKKAKTQKWFPMLLLSPPVS
jgi:hypothetical protein